MHFETEQNFGLDNIIQRMNTHTWKKQLLK